MSWLAHAGFWRFADRDDRDVPPAPAAWPSVVAVVPARDEADVIAATVAGLLAQDYPGSFEVRLVDDGSTDGTAAAARTAANGDPRLTILTAPPRPPGWTGKLWALARGVDAAGAPDWLWLTDADIGHAPDTLRNLVCRTGDGRVMVSTMARLHCTGLAERALIPAFVYFFAMLYPFARVNGRGDTAAAAGGCILVRRNILQRAGGIARIAPEIIDDCALARRVKPYGRIWLGLSTRSRSLRPYAFDDIRRMVARSAYAQLGYSPWRLAGTLAGMALIYLTPVALALFGQGALQLAGLGVWLVMATSMVPILRYYRVSPLWGVALPFIAATYAGFTLDSAIQHWRGRGGMWKGRAQAHVILPGFGEGDRAASGVVEGRWPQPHRPSVAQEARHLPEVGEDRV